MAEKGLSVVVLAWKQPIFDVRPVKEAPSVSQGLQCAPRLTRSHDSPSVYAFGPFSKVGLCHSMLQPATHSVAQQVTIDEPVSQHLPPSDGPGSVIALHGYATSLMASDGEAAEMIPQSLPS